MLENPSDSYSLANPATIKRYAPPNQRNRSVTRRKSGADRFERIANSYGNDVEKNPAAISRHITPSEYGSAIGSSFVNENPHSRLIPLQGFSKSEAFQLLKDRWTAALNAVDDPSVDLADRPVIYSGSGAPAWGSIRLPHQLVPSTTNAGTSGGQRDFLGELRQAIHDADASAKP